MTMVASNQDASPTSSVAKARRIVVRPGLAHRPGQCHAPPRRQRWRHDGPRQTRGRKTGAIERVAEALSECSELSGDEVDALLDMDPGIRN